MSRAKQAAAPVTVVRVARVDDPMVAKMVVKAMRKHSKLKLRDARTNADKQRAVRAVLALESFVGKSDRQIAEHVGVHHEMVGKIRVEIGGNRQSASKPGDKGKPPARKPTKLTAKAKAEAAKTKTAPALSSFASKSDRQIAEHVGVDHQTVAKYRGEFPQSVSKENSKTKKPPQSSKATKKAADKKKTEAAREAKAEKAAPKPVEPDAEINAELDAAEVEYDARQLANKPPAMVKPLSNLPPEVRMEFEGDMPLGERIHLASAVASLLQIATYPGNDGNPPDAETLYSAARFLACVTEEVDRYFNEWTDELPSWEQKRKLLPGRERDHTLAPKAGEE